MKFSRAIKITENTDDIDYDLDVRVIALAEHLNRTRPGIVVEKILDGRGYAVVKCSVPGVPRHPLNGEMLVWESMDQWNQTRQRWNDEISAYPSVRPDMVFDSKYGNDPIAALWRASLPVPWRIVARQEETSVAS